MLWRDVVVCIPDSNLQKFQPPYTCGTRPILTLQTLKIHGQLPKFGTENFMLENSFIYP